MIANGREKKSNGSWRTTDVPIPLQNVYYLLCYAWNRLDAWDRVDVSSIPGNRIENLLAKVLSEGTSHLLRSGLDRSYVPEQREERSIRGKLLYFESARRLLLQRGVAACSVDELSHDIPHNRLLKAGLKALMGLETVDDSLKPRLRSLLQALNAVTDVPLAARAFRGIQLHRNNARYALLLQFCELLARSLLPAPEKGRHRFHPFTASDQQMGELFQAFVRNFLTREQTAYRVSAPKLGWGETATPGTPPGWMPEMRTDAVLEGREHIIVAELKYYAKPAEERYGNQRLRSNHLYQLGTYLDHYRESHDVRERRVSGLLLYAGPPNLPPQSYDIRGRRVCVRSLRLDQPWQGIHDDLLGLVASVEA
jgi:5-methylcytosine-specific restriction enzyme subunit McrC